MKALHCVASFLGAIRLGLVSLVLVQPALAAPGDVDLSFDPGSGVNGTVFAAAVQADGKILIGGEFTTVGGAMRRCIARLNGDGSCDFSFDPGAGVDGSVKAIALQPDGQVLIGGDFWAVDGTARTGLARLHSDGSLDDGFDPQLSPGAEEPYPAVASIVLQADGSLVIGGAFSAVDGTERQALARLDELGGLDPGFLPALEAGDTDPPSPPSRVRSLALAVQADGKVLSLNLWAQYHCDYGEDWQQCSYQDSLYVLDRFNADGSRDAGFNASVALYGAAYASNSAIALLPNGKILVSGGFSRVNGVVRPITRLNSDGSVDASFNPGSAVNTKLSAVSSILPLADGKVLVGAPGSFQVNQGSYQASILRLHEDGTFDETFQVDTNLNGSVHCLVGLPDGKVIAAGRFTTVHGVITNRVARFHSGGTLDEEFDSGAGFGSEAEWDYSVHSVAALPGGKVVAGGQFSTVQQIERPALCLFHSDGRADEAFDATITVDPRFPFPIVESVVVQPDGKLLIGGQFAGVHGTSRNRIARLHPGGDLDETFDPGTGVSGSDYPVVRAVALPSDGTVLAGGCFTHVDGVERNSLVQLDPNGAVAEAYDPALQSNESVYALMLQPDGKVLVGGSFTTPVSDPESGWEYSVPSHLLVRLNTDGTRDTGFEVTAGFIDPESPFTSSFVYTIAVQPDGGILAGGSFTAFKGARLTALARLHADGTLNNTFDAAIDGAGAYVRSILLQPDGRILIGGYFDTVDGVERHGIARLNADGSLDESFAQGPGADHVIASLALRPDGKLLLGGLFSSIHGVVCPRLARLHGDDTTPSLTIEQTNGSLLLSWPSALDYHALEKSEDLGRLHPWSPVTETADDDGTRVRVTFPIEAPNMFFRLRSP